MLPALAWLLVITLLSTKGNVPLPKFNLIGADKFGHAAAYCLLAWLILLGFTWAVPARRFGFSQALGAFLFASGYGILMEFVQYTFFPNRFFEYDDMLANCIGAAIGWFVFVRIFPARNRIFNSVHPKS